MGNTLSSEFWAHFQDRAGREVYVLSGTCILDPAILGPSDGSRWQRGETSFEIPLHELPSGQGLIVEHWAPTVVLGSIQNDGSANNAGWAVDDFNLVPLEGGNDKLILASSSPWEIRTAPRGGWPTRPLWSGSSAR